MAGQLTDPVDEDEINYLYPEYVGDGDRLVKKQGGEWVVIGVVVGPPTVDHLYAYYTVDTEDGNVRMDATARLGHRVPVILKSTDQA